MALFHFRVLNFRKCSLLTPLRQSTSNLSSKGARRISALSLMMGPGRLTLSWCTKISQEQVRQQPSLHQDSKRLLMESLLLLRLSSKNNIHHIVCYICCFMSLSSLMASVLVSILTLTYAGQIKKCKTF